MLPIKDTTVNSFIAETLHELCAHGHTRQDLVALLDGTKPSQMIPVKTNEFIVVYYVQLFDASLQKDTRNISFILHSMDEVIIYAAYPLTPANLLIDKNTDSYESNTVTLHTSDLLMQRQAAAPFNVAVHYAKITITA